MKKVLIVLAIIITLPTFCLASKIKVSSLGLQSTDQTTILRKAVNSNYDTVVIDNIGRIWYTGPLKITRSNMTVIFEPGVHLAALPGAYPEKLHSVFTIQGSKNLRFVGNKASLSMNPEEYNDGDWRMGFRILDADNIRIENLIIHHCAGDGIYISRWSKNCSSNIFITDCSIYGNKRHSISIVSGRNVFVKNCELNGNKGKNGYSCGTDIEPNKPDEYIENIVFENCRFNDNQLTGITTCFQHMTKQSPPVSVTFRNCRVDNNLMGVRLINSKEDGPRGFVRVENTTVNNNRSYGLMVASTPSIQTEISGTTFQGNANGKSGDSPILIDGTYNNQQALIRSAYGGVTFYKSKVIDQLNRPFIKYKKGNGKMSGVSGTLDYEGPYSSQSQKAILSSQTRQLTIRKSN